MCVGGGGVGGGLIVGVWEDNCGCGRMIVGVVVDGCVSVNRPNASFASTIEKFSYL